MDRQQKQEYAKDRPRLAHISVEDSLALLREQFGTPGFLLIDTRTPGEFSDVRLEGSRLIDCHNPAMLSELDSLDRDGCYLLYCRSGNRSGMVLGLMERMGFCEAYNMSGGIRRWMELGLPVLAGTAEP